MVYRRGRFCIAVWYLGVALSWAISVLLTFALYAELFGLHGWTWERVGVTAGTGLVTFAAIRNAWALRLWMRPFRTNLLEIGGQGIHLRTSGEGEVRIAWPEISAIRSEQRTATSGTVFPIAYRVDDYILTTSRGLVTFTSIDIPRASQAAQQIAERIK